MEKFIPLAPQEKISHIWNNGNFITSRIENTCLVSLYAIRSFFVEIWFDRNKESVIKVKAHKTSKCIQRYKE